MSGPFSIQSLASGSKGNCWVLRAGDLCLLIDAGISAKRIVEGLTASGTDPESIGGVLLTHEHSDHLSGIPVLSRRFGYTTYAVEEAANVSRRRNGSLRSEKGVRIEPIAAGEEFSIGEVKIRPFSVSHDAVDPVMFVFEYQDRRLGLATDLGIVTRLVRQKLTGLDALVIESNHDPSMLEHGPYRPEDKRRIKAGWVICPTTRRRSSCARSLTRAFSGWRWRTFRRRTTRRISRSAGCGARLTRRTPRATFTSLRSGGWEAF
ncbi:MAG: MBL fold metallo-hydrolase [Deltaproteobacteria bacterium]|nr:MBL fold metallo-hydrolase [Deltaproteobacteria bacterium]